MVLPGGRRRDVWEYDISMNSWDQKTSLLPTGERRYLHTAVMINNKMYVFSGDKYSTDQDDLWEYNISADSWIEKASGATARRGHSAAAYNNKMYIYGAWRDSEETSWTDFWVYDPASNEWEQKESDKTPYRRNQSMVAYMGKLYVFGGKKVSSSDICNDVRRYII